jgi:hypothetical protein
VVQNLDQFNKTFLKFYGINGFEIYEALANKICGIKLKYGGSIKALLLPSGAKPSGVRHMPYFRDRTEVRHINKFVL